MQKSTSKSSIDDYSQNLINMMQSYRFAQTINTYGNVSISKWCPQSNHTNVPSEILRKMIIYALPDAASIKIYRDSFKTY